MRDRLERARAEVEALAVAVRDPRTPRHARFIAGLTVGLALSPIDPVPDFVPVLGYLDDLVFVPLGAYLAWRAVPDEVISDARERAGEGEVGAYRWIAAALVVLGWAIVGVVVVRLVV